MKKLQRNTYEQNLSLHLLFIDYRHAQDTIKKKLLEVMAKLGVPSKLRKLMGMTIGRTENKVTLGERLVGRIQS